MMRSEFVMSLGRRMRLVSTLVNIFRKCGNSINDPTESLDLMSD